MMEGALRRQEMARKEEAERMRDFYREQQGRELAVKLAQPAALAAGLGAAMFSAFGLVAAGGIAPTAEQAADVGSRAAAAATAAAASVAPPKRTPVPTAPTTQRLTAAAVETTVVQDPGPAQVPSTQTAPPESGSPDIQ